MSGTYDAFLHLLTKRHSCRSFTDEPLNETTLAALHEAFTLAPQAGGGRKLACSFITEPAKIRELAQASSQAFVACCEGISSDFIREETLRYGENFFWFKNAPALAFVTCRAAPPFLKEIAGSKAPQLWGGEASAAMGAFALLLAAESLGLGACCLTGPLAVWQKMEALLNITQQESLVLLVALGKKRTLHD